MAAGNSSPTSVLIGWVSCPYLMKHPAMNNLGYFHLHLLSLGFFFLAMVGAWHIYSSLKQNRLSSEMSTMLNDYSILTKQAITNSPDRQKIERNLQEISQIINKANPASKSTSGSFYNLGYPYRSK